MCTGHYKCRRWRYRLVSSTDSPWHQSDEDRELDGRHARQVPASARRRRRFQWRQVGRTGSVQSTSVRRDSAPRVRTTHPSRWIVVVEETAASVRPGEPSRRDHVAGRIVLPRVCRPQLQQNQDSADVLAERIAQPTGQDCVCVCACVWWKAISSSVNSQQCTCEHFNVIRATLIHSIIINNDKRK